MRREKDIFAFLGLAYVEPSERAGPMNIVPAVAVEGSGANAGGGSEKRTSRKKPRKIRIEPAGGAGEGDD
jgi:hypothetical protein